MPKKRKKIDFVSLLIVIFLLLCSYGNVQAEEIQEEEIQEESIPAEKEVVTGMGKDGNVYEVTEKSQKSDNEEMIISPYALGGYIVNFNTKGNAVTNFHENVTNTAGYLNGAYGADAAYLGQYNGQVKFIISGVTGWVNASEVQIMPTSSAKSVSHYVVIGGRLWHRVTTNVSGENYATVLDNGVAPSYLREGQWYFSYDGHYFYTYDDFQKMLEDYGNGNRSRAVNKSMPFYNYYQYLPIRSTSDYSADTLNTLINQKTNSSSKMWNIGNSSVQNQNTYGVNALIMTGIAANESAWGNSQIARTKNNLFGLNAVDSSPGESANTYPSVDHCIKTFAETYMSKRYLNPNNWVCFGGFLGNKASGANVKYASDPYWGEKAAAVAWTLDRNGGSADQYKYTIGIKGSMQHANQHVNANVYSDRTTSSRVMYRTKSQRESAMIITDEHGSESLYRIQTDPVLMGNREGIDPYSGVYHFNQMQGYIEKSNVSLVPGDISTLRDVVDISWYYNSVKYVFDTGLMTGLNKTTFGPAENLARAQFAVILYRMVGSPSVAYEAVFPDVPDGIWYTKATIWGNKANIITGYEDNGYFGTGDYINREQMAVMMYRYAQYRGYDTSKRTELSGYQDASVVNDFAKDAMEWAVASGLIMGDGGLLNPQGTANRAVCATIVTRFVQRYP